MRMLLGRTHFLSGREHKGERHTQYARWGKQSFVTNGLQLWGFLPVGGELHPLEEVGEQQLIRTVHPAGGGRKRSALHSLLPPPRPKGMAYPSSQSAGQIIWGSISPAIMCTQAWARSSACFVF